jgi:hypothetical protein
MFGENYTRVVQKRTTLSKAKVMDQVEDLQVLVDVLEQLREQTTSSDIAHLSDVVQGAEGNASRLFKEFTHFQREARQCASCYDDEVVALKLTNRDSARADLCRGLQELMDSLARDLHKVTTRTHLEGKGLGNQKLSHEKNKLQRLQRALGSARDCVIKLNEHQSNPSARVGAGFKATSCKFGDVDEALRLWGAWKDSMPYEEIANATDACMQVARAACAQGVAGVLGTEEQQQQQLYVGMKDALGAAGKAVDREAALHDCTPMLMVPVTPLFRAAENLVLSMQARVAVLQHACTLYDNACHLLEAQSQCLDGTGPKYIEMQRACHAMQEASKAHSRAGAKLKKDKLMEQHPELAEDEGLSMAQLRENMKEKKKVLKDAAEVLHQAIMSLLAVQDYFPEVCKHLKAGLPSELLAVWRPDLTMEMFEARETLSSASNHIVYKASMDGKTYALKEFKLTCEEGLKELMREAAALRRVRHPAIVEVLGVFEDTSNKTMLLQMHYFEHGTLDTWVDKEAPEWRTVRTVLLDIAGALEHLHASSVVHCDVKPPNILIAPFFRGRLADFDISVDSATRTSTNFAATRVQYTAGFDAPELHRYYTI